MKYINQFKSLSLAALIAASTAATAQDVVRPLHFGAIGTGTTTNWYTDYVGIRFQVVNPMAIAGDKVYTTPNDGIATGTGVWAGPAVNMIDTVKFATPDSIASGAFSAGFFTGKIALIWRGGGVEFGYKALQAQNAGAVACVIVNNVPGGPVGMAAGSSGGSVTIPVYQISLDDGLDMTAQMRAGQTVILNINTRWYSGYNHDLGFVPAGYAMTANNAMPRTQLHTATTPDAYKNKNGAFVANYGSRTQTNVKLKSATWFTPNGGSRGTSPIQTDSVTLATFTVADSIWAMYAPTSTLPSQSTNGKYELMYKISADSADQFTGDNNFTYTFYTTDSLWSKGRFDFTRNKPVTTSYARPGGTSTDPFLFFTPYYVANGTGTYFDKVQFSVVDNVAGANLLASGIQVMIYVFKWTDTNPADSFMENQELQLVGAGVKTFDGIADSDFQTFTVPIYSDTLNGGFSSSVPVSGNSWYLIGAEMPNGYALGIDGVMSGLPRSFGRQHFTTGGVFREYYNPIWAAGDRRLSTNSMVAFPAAAVYPYAFDGVGAYDVDSVMYDNQKGMIPALPFTTTTHPVNGVKEVANPFQKLEVFPNPTSDVVNVNLALNNPAKTVSYRIMDLTGKVISLTSHSNVQSTDNFTFNTVSLPAGNYYIIVAADNKTSFKKFTVAH